MTKLKFVSVLMWMIFASPFAGADYSSVTQMVEQFNHLNNEQGAQFTIQVNSSYSSAGLGSVWQGEVRVNTLGETPDLSAYSSLVSGSNYFQTFCIQTEQFVYTGTNYSGTLDLSSNTQGYYTTTVGLGSQAVTEGAATLYRLFATGELQQYDYAGSHASDAAELQAAFWKLQGQTANSVTALTPSDWSTNRYLAQLIDINSNAGDWLSSYDPTTDDSGYAVFAMNNIETETGKYGQNFLYIARDISVPEPATLCLWGVGLGAGLLWARHKRRSR